MKTVLFKIKKAKIMLLNNSHEVCLCGGCKCNLYVETAVVLGRHVITQNLCETS